MDYFRLQSDNFKLFAKYESAYRVVFCRIALLSR